MFNFFIFLFAISIVLILILHYGVQKEKTKKLLHDFKNSCKISSVRFEDLLKKILKKIREIKGLLVKKKKNALSKIQLFLKKIVICLKKRLRKKLFEQGKNQSISSHIISIKNDIDKQ